MRFPLRSHVFLFAFAALFACHPSQTTELGHGGIAPGEEVSAPTPSVASYETTVPAGEPMIGGGDAAGVVQGVNAAAAGRSMTITGDPRLATLAQQISDHLDDGGEPPPAEVIQFFAWNLGLVEPVPHVLVLGLPDRVSIADQVQRSMDQFLGRQPYTHWGGVILPRSGVWLIVIALSSRDATMEAVPRAPASGPLVVRGTLGTGFSNPVVAVQQPNGSTTRIPGGAGPGFDLHIPITGGGEHHVELLADGPRGDSVIANFPVYVGGTPPRSIRVRAASAPTSGSTDVQSVHDDLLRMLNETRAQAGLPAIVIDPRAEAVALAHSQDMASHDFTGHESPTTGSPADRVRAAGLHSGLVLENIGRGYSAQEIHDGLVASPGHRANLVNADANVVGIGVVADASDGRTAFIATEVFLRFAQPIDVSAAPQTVLDAINHARTARGARAVSMEPNLQQAAQDAASAFFSHPSMTTQDAVDQASTAMRRFSLAFRRLGGVMAVVTVLDEATELEPSFEEDVDYVGIGVAQGSRPDTGENAIAVVIMLGWAR
jgi:uncharacterized protein YkwD